jgi:hypothetical protein
MMGTTACYQKKSAGRAEIHFNTGSLGMGWFDCVGATQDEPVIHDLAHHRERNHYSEEFHEACCEVGAGLKQLAMKQPGRMAEFTGAAMPSGDFAIPSEEETRT